MKAIYRLNLFVGLGAMLLAIILLILDIPFIKTWFYICAWWPLILVPPWMRTLGHLSPVAWCLDALNAVIFHQGTWSDVLLPSGVLTLFAGVCFVFGAKVLNRLSPSRSNRLKMPSYFEIQTLDPK